MATSVVLGAGRIAAYNVFSAGYYVASGLGSLAGAWVSGTARGAVLAWALTTFAWAIASSAYVATAASDRSLRHLSREWRPVLRFGLPSHVSNVVTYANYRLDLFLVGVFIGAAGAGQYAAVVGVAEVLWFTSITASTVLFAEVAVRTDSLVARALAERVARLVLWSTLVMAIVTAVFAGPLLGLLYGAEFVGSASSLRVLLIGVVALGLSRVLANHIAASGFPSRNIFGSVVALAVSLTLDLLLIPRWGVMGAAVSSSVAYAAALAHRLRIFGETHPDGRRRGLGYLRPRVEDLRVIREVVRSPRAPAPVR
jgi:O-antigen/teichoic acid export membrane protein